jgi:nucleoside-diphosphate-sugar epimerase
VKALVTGAHGFVGSHLVTRLLDQGTAVRCLNRRREVPERLRGLPVEVVAGDLADGQGLDAAVRGVDEVWHLGALTRAPTRRTMWAVNAGGTRRLVEAAVAAGLPGRFVLCSSLAAVGPASRGKPREGHEAPTPRTTYGASKLGGERALAEAGAALDWVVVRPPAVYGPRDRDFLGVFRTVAGGWMPCVGGAEREVSLVHVEDLAEGLLVAGRSPATRGAAWFVTSDPVVTQGALLGAVRDALGVRARAFGLPTSVLRLAGELSDLGAQLTGVLPLLTRERVREVGEGHWTCSGEALARATGWRARIPLAEGLAATAAWYRAAGLL